MQRQETAINFYCTPQGVGNFNFASNSTSNTIFEKLTIIVIDLVCSSIIMLPYCRSLWQKPIHWLLESFLSNSEISSPRAFKQNASASSWEHNRLAVFNQSLKIIKNQTISIYRLLQCNIFSKQKRGKKTEEYRNLSQSLIILGPGMSRSWNSLNLAAIRADTSGSRRSAADSVCN